MGLTGAAKLWLLIKPIKRIKEFRNKETKEVFKGKLTYSALAVVMAPFVARFVGFEVAESDIVALFQAAAVFVGFYGRFRATRG